MSDDQIGRTGLPVGLVALGGLLDASTLAALRRPGLFAYLAEKR